MGRPDSAELGRRTVLEVCLSGMVGLVYIISYARCGQAWLDSGIHLVLPSELSERLTCSRIQSLSISVGAVTATGHITVIVFKHGRHYNWFCA